MHNNIPDFYKKALFHICQNVTGLSTPNVKGTQNSVIIVKSGHNTYIAKFNSRNIVEKNQRISHLYYTYGIPVPDVRAVQYQGQWIEIYPMISGKTLQEQIDEGMEKDKIYRAYEDILINFTKMGNIPCNLIREQKVRTVEQTMFEHHRKTHVTLAANLIYGVVSIINMGARSDKGLYHADISPRNVIVSDDGHLKSFIDLDSVSICHRTFALGAAATRWHNMGYNINELLDMYEEISGRDIDRNRVKNLAWMNRASKYILGAFKRQH